ncbi:hypothetical protein JIR23_14225 [Bradyrhizobium diazoefficiens]|nr:hypothetical protein [Bradyrhizobium diazoefficiens]QQN66752.1 hypothetical protein JIR23_14225 [Bradyrhizobium diazoefficiens]
MPGGSKRDSKTWLYERGTEPRLALIKTDVGVEAHFYSELSPDGTPTLDDKITEYEDAAAQRLQLLKGGPAHAEVDAEIAAELVAHLTIRNAHLRGTFTMAARKLFGQAIDVFCDETRTRQILGIDGSSPPQALKDLIDGQLNDNPAFRAFGLPAHVLYQVAQMTLREQFKSYFAEQVLHIAAAMDHLVTQAPAYVRDGHNKVLSTTLAPDPRIAKLKALSWRVMPSPGEGFVLPDCVALGLDDATGLKPLMMADLDLVTVVLMPLSTDRMLAGLHSSAIVPDLNDFNRAAAASSHNFFIAARRDDSLTNLSQVIGGVSTEFVRSTIGSVFGEFLASRAVSHDPNGSDAIGERPKTDLPDAERHEASPVAPTYTIEFHSCANEATRDKIAATVRVITDSLVQMMPLDRLDGITFSHDIAVSLRDLDRGFEASAPLQPTREDYGTGVAMAPLVVRNGVIKSHIVIQGEIGHGLISDDEALWRLCLHTVARQLAFAASAQILDEALPGVLLRKFDERFDGFLYGTVHSAWTGYFSSRASAALYPEAGDAQRELLLSVLHRAANDIPAARLAYRFHGNLDQFLDVAMPRIGDVLQFCGTVLGHYDGLEKSILDDSVVLAALERSGLRDWITLFDTDLSRLWDRRGNWVSFDEFLALNRHVERLLWQFGLFPWRTEDGRISISVPLGTDMDKLVGWRPRLRLIRTRLAGRIKRLSTRIAVGLR